MLKVFFWFCGRCTTGVRRNADGELGPAQACGEKGAAHEKRGAASRIMPSPRGEKNGIYDKNVRQHNMSPPILRPGAYIIIQLVLELNSFEVSLLYTTWHGYDCTYRKRSNMDFNPFRKPL